MDNLTSTQRKRAMAAVKSKNTAPEKAIRSIVHGLGFRYRLHSAGLPGKPDLVLRRHRKIILSTMLCMGTPVAAALDGQKPMHLIGLTKWRRTSLVTVGI